MDRGLVARLPQLPRDLAMLARFDRPIGWWLLFWPCVWGLWLAGAGWQWALLGWFLVGSIAMRGAGCVYNDIVDANLDRQVARTASRPVASGRVSVMTAWIWLVVLCLVGLIVLLAMSTVFVNSSSARRELQLSADTLENGRLVYLMFWAARSRG